MVLFNRAAAYEQLEQLECVVTDCSKALELNHKYVKALDRRAKILRKQASKISGDKDCEDDQLVVDKLKMALEDITSACILDGFQRQDQLMMVDAILKELGKLNSLFYDVQMFLKSDNCRKK